jgi:UDP-N-acetylglucosamine/UDP-N-acetylgalactosamine diphosphorylase
MSDRRGTIQRTLDAHGQSHLLQFYDELTASQQADLLAQIEAIDFEAFAQIVADGDAGEETLPDGLEPAPYYPYQPDHPGAAASAADGTRLAFDPAAARAAGEKLIAEGRVAAFTVAGGQGTRLGWNGPKGTYPATPVTGKPLFRCFAEQIMAAQRRSGATIPWYIMTSPVNDAETRAFFVDNNCFGLPRTNIFMFPQGTLPSVDAQTGKILLADKHLIAVNPDGHGGAIRALRSSGAIEDMRARGVEFISYFQVDNPLARVIDPLFIGLHATASDSSGAMSSKMVAKAGPEEKVGVFARTPGPDGTPRTTVLEYSDLPETLAHERDEQGDLRYRAGSIAIHVISVAFIERLTADEHHFALPYHRARKVVPHVDLETGERVEPMEPNGVKFETFVFDALALADGSIVYETDRVQEFAPIKNGTGADSPATSHELQTERAARWLEAHGVSVARDGEGRVAARLEISPLTALEPADLVAVDLPSVMEAGEEYVI